MTGLFVRFYLCVLVVLAGAWYLHGEVLTRRSIADKARVTAEAHGGGARLVAQELGAAAPDQRDQVLAQLRTYFGHPITLESIDRLPERLRRRIGRGEDVLVDSRPEAWSVVAPLDSQDCVVRLGPFVNYDRREIEESLGGWMRLTARRIQESSPPDRDAYLTQLSEQFEFPITLASSDDALPNEPRHRLASGSDVVLFNRNDDWFTATPFQDRSMYVVFGPLPEFDQIEHKAATTTLAVVLLPVAGAIALLLRPVARQLRYVERTAEAIASGDLSARVDEGRVNSTRSLAHSFNHMAERTETLVRTQRELLQAVSHELRTPLSRMRFAIDLISTAENDEDRAQRLQALDDATDELDSLVGELLSYVRVASTDLTPDFEQLAIRDSLDQVVARAATQCPDISFELEISHGLEEGLLVVEPAGFQRALGNLLSNAGRFAATRVKVTAAGEQGRAVIDVDDDGPGIAAEDRQRVFEPFVRLSDPANDKTRGVGLGLALVKRIVAQHGGRAQALDTGLGGCRIRTDWPTTMAASEDDVSS